MTNEPSNYERARARPGDVPRATLYATLALVDAVNRLADEVVAFRQQVADDARLMRGEPISPRRV